MALPSQAFRGMSNVYGISDWPKSLLRKVEWRTLTVVNNYWKLLPATPLVPGSGARHEQGRCWHPESTRTGSDVIWVAREEDVTAVATEMFAFRHGACPKSTHTIFLSFLFFLILRITRPPPNAVQTRPTVIWDRVCVCYHQPRPGRLWSGDCCTNCCIHTKEKNWQQTSHRQDKTRKRR